MNPVLIDFPSEFVTERLHLRMPMPGDGKAVYEAIQASITELKPWLPFAHEEQSEQNTEANIRIAHAKFLLRENMRLHIFHRESGEFIGSSGLHRPDWTIRKFVIGYWIDTRHRGQGFMTEAVEEITAFALSELKANRLEIHCDTLNVRSRAIPERLGFSLEGILLRDDLSADGTELRDTAIYAKISS